MITLALEFGAFDKPLGSWLCDRASCFGIGQEYPKKKGLQHWHSLAVSQYQLVLCDIHQHLHFKSQRPGKKL